MKYLNQQRNMRAAADKLVRYSSVSNQHIFHLQRNMYLAENGKNVKIDLYCAALWQQTHYG
ncbi:hypothetical protein T06_9458 [Trichinella sp. T6]|nr:hypothetical protein T06_9458 [Trichinella sp. T6]